MKRQVEKALERERFCMYLNDFLMWMDHVLKVESNHSKSGHVTRVCRTAVRR